MVRIDPPAFKGNILDAIEARHRRGREKVDLYRVRSSPWRSSIAKKKIRERIEQLVESGAPRADQAIEHDVPISFPTRTHQVQVLNAGLGAVGFVELPDAVASYRYLFRDELVARLDRDIEQCADDKNASTAEQRRDAEAQILADPLAVEREACAPIEVAQSQGFFLFAPSAQCQAYGIKLPAERKAGALLREMEKAKGGRPMSQGHRLWDRCRCTLTEPMPLSLAA